MTSKSTSSPDIGGKEEEGEDLDDFLNNMDKQRAVIDARIMAAYAATATVGPDGRRGSQTSGARDEKYLDQHNDDDLEEDCLSSSSASLLISSHGDGNFDSQETARSSSSSDGGGPSALRRSSRSNRSDNIFMSCDHHNDDDAIGAKDCSDAATTEEDVDDVYRNITRQSQQLYDKLNTSYTMTTHNSSPSASSVSYLENSMSPQLQPSSLVGKVKIVETVNEEDIRMGAEEEEEQKKRLRQLEQQQQQLLLLKQQKQQQQQKTAAITKATQAANNELQDDDIIHDIYAAGSKESYEWVLQQLSPKRKKEKEVLGNNSGSRRTDGIRHIHHHRETDIFSSATPPPSSRLTETKSTSCRATKKQESKPNNWLLRGDDHNRVFVILKVNNNSNVNHTSIACDASHSSSSLRGGDGNILFPILLENERDYDDGGINNDANKVHERMESNRGKIVLVNPNIFNNENDDDDPILFKKRLTSKGSSISDETARLVAQVSQISSTEDWAREYQFDDIIGMSSFGMDANATMDDQLLSGGGGRDDNDNITVNRLTLLAQSVAEEACDGSGSKKCSSVLCAVGGTKSGKTRMIFGPFISTVISSSTTTTTTTTTTTGVKVAEESTSNLGLVGDIIQPVLQCNHQCSISILEIADDDVLRDILGFSEDGLNGQNGTSALRLRHGDKKRGGGGGSAIVENLWQVPVTTYEDACDIIFEAFQSRPLRRIWREEGGHGHFVVTISCSKGSADSVNPCIQLVDLASPDRQAMAPSSSRVGSIRKSLSALGGILRQLAEKHPNFSTSSSLMPVSFRECTLTKVLQRNLEGRDTNGASRIVIGCVNPSSRHYSQTLRTMDFMTRISAKTGEAVKNPFLDDSPLPPIAAATSVTATPQESDGSLLRSIVSDPRQRLAKLLTPQSYNKGSRKGSHEKVLDITTPRSSSAHSDGMTQQRFQDTYNSVFDQLDNLMSTEEEEDDVDRNSYGDKIIQAITPNPKSLSKKKVRSEPSPETETEDFFMSPLYNLTPPVAQHPNRAKDLTCEIERAGNLPHDQQEETTVKKNLHSVKKVSRTADEVETGPPLFSEIQWSTSSDGENWNEFSPVSSNRGLGNDNQDVFVEKSTFVPLKTLVSHDSMDSQLLVSCRSEANVKGGLASFCLDSVDLHKLPAARYEKADVAEVDQDVSTMVESFQQEVEALIKESPVSKYISKDGVAGRMNCHDGLLPARDNEDYTCTNSSVIKTEVFALNTMLDKLKKEKAAADLFVQKLHRIMTDTESDSSEDDVSFPSNFISLINNVRQLQATLVDLRRELDECKPKNIEIKREVEQIGTPSSISTKNDTEKDLARAKEVISEKDKKSLVLENELRLERARAKELSSEKASLSTLLGEIDEILDIGAPSNYSVYDTSRQKLRLERMEGMLSGLRQLSTKNQDLGKLLRETRAEGQKARELVEFLETKVNEMQSQANQSQGSNSHAVEAAEKLAEEAIHANETLTREIAQLQSSIKRIRDEYQSLSRNHGVCKEEKSNLEEQLASFSSMAAEMMKQRVDEMKEDYTRRLSLQQAKITHLEEQIDMRQTTALSSAKNELAEKQSENEILRMRIAQIEKETLSKLQFADASLHQVQTELKNATEEAKIQRDENTTLQSELSHLRGIIDVAEQSVDEVNRLRIENEQLLQESIRSQRDQQTQDTSFEVPFEVRGKRNLNVSFLNEDDDYFMKERITALMRENEQNNISMRSLQSENLSLKSSVEQCNGTIEVMRLELNDLKSMTSEGLSKMRTRHEKDRVTIAELEKKLEGANNLIRRLRPSVSGMKSAMDEISSPSRRSIPNVPQITRRFETSFTPYDAAERKINAELSAEKELRYKAEEICAGVLADAKLGFEERDKEIERLRSKLYKVSRGYL